MLWKWVGEPASVRLSHCTLVPGRELEGDGRPRHPNEPSLRLGETVGPVTIDHCLLGAVHVQRGEERTEPISITLQDSILDALSPSRDALTGPEGELAHALLTARRVTVFGALRVHALLLAENSLLTGDVQVARRQIGCLRFCYAPPGSRTPPRFGCQPDGVAAKLSGARLEEEQERVARRSSSAPATASPRMPKLRSPAPRRSRAGRMTNRRWACSTTCSGRSGRPTCKRAWRNTRPPASRPGSSMRIRRAEWCGARGGRGEGVQPLG